MAAFDIQQLVITQLTNASVSVPRFTISCVIKESKPGGAILFDFTGANVVSFPAILATLTAAQQDEIMRLTLTRILQIKTGL